MSGNNSKTNDNAHRRCKIDGCTRRHSARGFCEGHYRIFLRFGDPLAKSNSLVCEEVIPESRPNTPHVWKPKSRVARELGIVAIRRGLEPSMPFVSILHGERA